MGRFTTPRRRGSTGGMMHAASRSAWNNRGSNAAYYAGRELPKVEFKYAFVALISVPLTISALAVLGTLISGEWLLLLLWLPVSIALTVATQNVLSDS